MHSRVRAAAAALMWASPAALAGPAPAPGDLSAPALPTFALTAPPTGPSPWAGLYVGSEVFGIAGSKGIRGGFGGAGYAGYDHETDNGFVIGLQGTAGYTPSLFSHSRVTGYDFAATDVRVGYDMGRFMPFVTAGIGFARPNVRALGGYTGVADSATDLLSSRGDLRAFETVGAGFAYRVTNRLTVELAVQAFHGNGTVVP